MAKIILSRLGAVVVSDNYAKCTKVLFLDIDGVLNGHEYDPCAESCKIKPECVKQLNRIIERTDAAIVLSSAWRYMVLNGAMTLSGFSYMLRTHGVTKYLNLIGTLPLDTKQVEGDEGAILRAESIVKWLEDREARGDDKTIEWPIWAAVDDLGLWDETNPNFVRTDGTVGLTEANADRLIALLNRRNARS